MRSRAVAGVSINSAATSGTGAGGAGGAQVVPLLCLDPRWPVATTTPWSIRKRLQLYVALSVERYHGFL